MGEMINGYELIEPLQNKDAGFSRWTYAKKKGKTYFLKEFMDPVYPTDNSLADTLRQRRIADCEAYEKKKSELYAAINKASDGNLVRILEFFRYDSHYYISTDKINQSEISFKTISALSLEKRLHLCKTISHSIMQLHEARIVHADIKDNNILIQKSPTGQFVGKIIDFDCSFQENTPPEHEEELGGDQVYLAPEACQFICGDAVKLTGKIDIFALGLLFHQYLTGKLPVFDHKEYDYAYEAVLDEQNLMISEELPKSIRSLIRRMLIGDPQKRCSAKEVFLDLCNYNKEEVPGITDEPKKESAKVRTEDSTSQNESFSPQSFFHSAGDL